MLFVVRVQNHVEFSTVESEFNIRAERTHVQEGQRCPQERQSRAARVVEQFLDLCEPLDSQAVP